MALNVSVDAYAFTAPHAALAVDVLVTADNATANDTATLADNTLRLMRTLVSARDSHYICARNASHMLIDGDDDGEDDEEEGDDDDDDDGDCGIVPTLNATLDDTLAGAASMSVTLRVDSSRWASVWASSGFVLVVALDVRTPYYPLITGLWIAAVVVASIVSIAGLVVFILKRRRPQYQAL